jgi:signal transduction histidine kinase
VSSLLKTDEFKIISTAALLIALPSIVLSVVALAVLARESHLADERLRDAHEGSMDRAVARTLSPLRAAEGDARALSRRIAEQDLPGEEAWARARALCGEDKAFREAYLVDRSGRVIRPDVAPDLEPAPPEGEPEAPEVCRSLLASARALEFAGKNAPRAARAWKALHEACLDLEGAQAVRLSGVARFGQARCEAKSGRLAEARRLYRSVARDSAGVWGEGGIPLAPAALLEAARVAKRQGEAEAERDAWTRLGAVLGRNEERIPVEVLAFFLGEIRKAGEEDALGRFESFRTWRASLSAFQGRFGAVLKDGPVKAGYLASSVADESAFAAPVPGSEARAVHAALFLPNRAFLLERFRRWSAEAQLEAEVRIRLLSPQGRPLDHEEKIPEGFRRVSQKTFPEPLSGWRVALFMEKVRGVRALWILRWSLTLWVIVVAAVAVAGGTVFVVRAVNREIRLAREKADFVSSVTHELKTPLTSIRMFTETLMMDRVTEEEEKRECLRVIAEETDRLSRLINRMLDFSKMERGLRRFHFRMEDPGSILREAVQAFRSRGDAGAQIQVQVLEAPAKIRVDRDAVIEVLVNFLSNAVKYNRDGAGVTARLWGSGGRVKFAVMDRGIGIPKAEQKRIFEKFYRVDESLTKEVDGCGLGLSISAHIARAHGGGIELESEPGRGSIFTLVVPENGPKSE